MKLIISKKLVYYLRDKYCWDFDEVINVLTNVDRISDAAKVVIYAGDTHNLYAMIDGRLAVIPVDAPLYYVEDDATNTFVEV